MGRHRHGYRRRLNKSKRITVSHLSASRMVHSVAHSPQVLLLPSGRGDCHVLLSAVEGRKGTRCTTDSDDSIDAVDSGSSLPVSSTARDSGAFSGRLGA